MDFEVDYAVPGAEPFSFQRCYISAPGDEESPLGNGWSRNYFGMIEKYKDEGAKREKRVFVHDSFGSMYHYGRYSDCYKLFRECYKTHVTNCSSGMMSARTNILNNKLKFEKKGKGIFTKCNGEKLTFKKMQYDEFYLTKQLKTTGNKLRYKYNNDYDCDLVKVEAFGKTGQPLGMVEYEYAENNKKTEISLKYGGKQKALYIMDNLESGYSQYIVAAYRVHAPYISYQYEPKSSECTDPNMIQKGYPNNRFQKIGYYQKGSNVVGNFQFIIKKDSSPWIGRVKCLQAPVGNDETPITTHKFIYNNLDEKSGSAEVYDAYDHLTSYTWDKYKRLSSLARYTGSSNHILTSVDRMYWGGDVTRDEILLSARTFENAAGEIQYMRAFEYDEYGNILYDGLYGNLTGKNQKPCRIFPNGKVIDNGCECYLKHFTYSNDESHLLISSTENDVTQVFAYKKDTDLLISKLHLFKNNIFKREFYDYDENAVLILEMEDDGSSDNRDDLTKVTERHIKRITPQTEAPVGLPWIVENKYLDLKTGAECLLNKTINKYCCDGRLTLKELYDANDKFIGQLIMGYDAHGNLIKEVDILGQETIRRYDSNDNKDFEEITGSGVHQEFIYDCSNRLVRVNEVHEDGIILTQTNTYNILSQKISSTDIYGNSTIYSYDDFGRLTGTTQPQIFYEDWTQATPKNRKEYNLFNTPKLSVDCNGHSTQIECNIRGQPTVTCYPDGTTEEIIYNLNGTTNKIIHPNGTYTCFKYDHLKRIVDKSIFDSKGTKLQSSTFKYSTFRLKSETRYFWASKKIHL